MSAAPATSQRLTKGWIDPSHHGQKPAANTTSAACAQSIARRLKQIASYYPALTVFVLSILAGYALCYYIFGSMMLPGGPLFALAALMIIAAVTGTAVGKIGIPPLLGMIA